MHPPEEIKFEEVIRALMDTENIFPPRYLHRLSDLGDTELRTLSTIWNNISLIRRQTLMADVEELAKTDMLLSFEALGEIAIQDKDRLVRLHSVHTLAEFENKQYIPIFERLLQDDPDIEVRSACASALGQYVYLGEIDELPPAKLQRIEDLLLAVIQGKDHPDIRRSALESMGYSSREEVTSLINEAYHAGDRDWMQSALFAMGRSGNEMWKQPVMEMLENAHPSLREEAARSAGELELTEALPLLFDLLDDPSDAIRFACIWSLSQIGGENVRQTLENLYEQADSDEEIDLLESALDNLVFTEEMKLMPLIDVAENEEDDLNDDIDDEIYESFFDEDEEDQED